MAYWRTYSNFPNGQNIPKIVRNFSLLCCVIISLYCLLSLCVGSANAWEFKPFDDWDKTEKALFASNSVLRTVDMLQTNDIYHHKEYHEINPFIDAGVDKFGTKFIPVWFVGMGVAEYLVVDALPHSWRKGVLGFTNAVSLGLVYHNNQIGLGLNFSF